MHSDRATNALAVHLSSRKICLVFLGAALAIWPTAALTDDYNQENFRYGDEALGTGGAFIARPTTPMATYYNPAGLAFQTRSAVSGSIHFLGRERFVLRDGLRSEGQVPKDLISEADVALPSSSVVTLRIDKQHRVAFSTYLKTSTNQRFQNAFRPNFTDENGVEHDSLMALNRTVQDRETWLGPSYAFALDDRFGFGISLFYARRSTYRRTQTRLQDERIFMNAPDQVVFYDSQVTTQVRDGRLLLRMGLSYQPSQRTALGLVVTSPSIRLHGEARLAVTELWSGDPETVDANAVAADDFARKTGAQTASPWGLSLGWQYTLPNRFRVAIATDVWAPINYRRMNLTDADDEEVALVREQLAVNVHRDWLINAKVGLELLTVNAMPIRMGAYTNRSAARAVPATSTRYVSPKVDTYGGALSLGYKRNGTGIFFGVNYERGFGHDTVEADILESYADAPRVRVERRRSQLLFFVAGALSFASKTAQRMLDKRNAQSQDAE